MRNLLAGFLILLMPSFASSTDLKGNWTLVKSQITYQVTHPLHKVQGKSVSARGKGECDNGLCRFLVAVPVQSFDSGDGNRDLHMLQITRGADNPLIKVNLTFAGKTEEKLPTQLTVDLEIEFAGKKVKYPRVELDVSDQQSEGARITGTIPLSLKDFDIKPPTLLGVPINDAVPVKLDMYWQKTRPNK